MHIKLMLYLNLLLMLINVQFSFCKEVDNKSLQKIIHFKQASQEFEKDRDRLKYDLRKARIQRYYKTNEDRNDIIKACKEAQSYFDQIKVNKKSLIIFDVDDTALYGKYEQGQLLGINKPLIKCIEPVLSLYKFLIAKGFNIIFLTNVSCDL